MHSTGRPKREFEFGSKAQQRLMKVKQQYDPTNLFRLNANINPSG